MKKFTILFFATCFSLSTLSSEIASLPSNLGVNYENRVFSLLELSKQTRRGLNGRKIASLNAEDRYWANEFDKIMNDESNKDYLKLCLELD